MSITNRRSASERLFFLLKWRCGIKKRLLQQFRWAQSCCASPLRTSAQLAKSLRTRSNGANTKRSAFARLFPWLDSVAVFVALLFASPAVGKFSRASSAGGRRRLLKNFVNWIVSVAEDCLSPERTFHGCPLMHSAAVTPWLIPWLIPWL